MHTSHADAFETYCLRCSAPSSESASQCAACGTPFTGSGAFDRIRGPRPSSLFDSLFRGRAS